MLINNRILAKVSGVIQDWSVNMNSFASGTKTLGALNFTTGDRLYIGGDMPFNHRYFEISTANAVVSVPSVELWNGKEWKAAVDVTDYSAVAGATLGASGIIQWMPDPDESWQLEDKTEDVTDLETARVYNMYWAKISFSANLTAGTALQYVGHRFSTEEDMNGRYPELVKSTSKTAFTAAKTSWNEQLVLAAETVVRDLRKQRLIVSPGNILGWELFAESATHKTAELIYNAFFSTQENKKASARKDYDEAMSAVSIGGGLDKDQDGQLSRFEMFDTVGLMRR